MTAARLGRKVEFQVGRINACVSEEDAVRLASHLLERETVAATRVAMRIMGALQEQVLDAAC